MWTFLACFAILSTLNIIVESKNCVQNDQCSCTFDDGSGTVDLSKIGTNGGAPL